MALTISIRRSKILSYIDEWIIALEVAEQTCLLSLAIVNVSILYS